MESNGKSVTVDGEPVDVATGEIVWSEPGTNGQHAFYQLLHQGTHLVPADFVAFAQPNHDLDGMHDLFLANFLAQPAALAFGRTEEEVAAEELRPPSSRTRPSRATVPPMPSWRPSSRRECSDSSSRPTSTGSSPRASVWAINSFDQWGVELGKVLARQLAPRLQSDEAPAYDSDSSTNGLIRLLREGRGRAV
jgi:glucose-6-phosphate isomerase